MTYQKASLIICHILGRGSKNKQLQNYKNLKKQTFTKIKIMKKEKKFSIKHFVCCSNFVSFYLKFKYENFL